MRAFLSGGRSRGSRTGRVLLGLGLFGILSGSGLLSVLPWSVPSDLREPSGVSGIHRVSARPDLRPSWSRGRGVTEVVKNPNLSVLGDSGYAVSDTPDALAEWLHARDGGHGRLGNELYQQWSARMEQFEMRERHHLAGQGEELELARSNRTTGSLFLRSLFASRLRDGLKRAEAKSDPVRAITRTNEKLDFMANTGMKLEVAPDVNFGSKADLLRQQGRVWMTSPWLNGSVDFRVGAEAEKVVAGMPTRNERYRVSFERSLPWEMQSNLSYGGTSQTMTTSLSRPLAPHLSCTLESRQNLLESSREQLARLNYQLRF